LAKYKIYKIAKELNLASPTIIEFLAQMDVDVSKGHMSAIPEDIYLEVVKKFDRPLWQSLQEQQKEEVLEKQKKSEKAREEELKKILDDKSEIAIPEDEAEIVEEEAAPESESVSVEEEVEVVEESADETSEAVEAIAEPEEPSEEDVAAEAETELKETAKRKSKKAQKAKPEEAEVKKAAEPEKEPPKKTAKPKEKEPEVEATEAVEAEESSKEAKQKAAKPKAKGSKGPEPGTIEAMMAEAKEDTMVARARKLKKAQDADGLAEEDELEAATSSKKRRLKRKKEDESAEEMAVKKAVERAQKAAEDRKRNKKPISTAPTAGDKEKEPGKKKKRRRKKKKKVDQKVVDASIKQTLASMEEKKPKKRKRKVQDAGEVLEDENVLKVMEFIPTNELAGLLDVPVSELIRKCMDMGLIVTINQRLDKDTMELLAGEYGYEIEFQSEFEGSDVAEEDELEEILDDEKDLERRPPVVTVMGHVDHGKTSLLDFIRKSNIIAGESGGITQHIGAYSVTYNDNPITFLDTPGHEAFTAMRARGAQVTDLVVLVVAADDHVMPQTLEAINHAKAASVPIIIAINKIDKANADPERVKRELSDRDILVEDWGGSYQCAEISAKKGIGVENLLEEIILAAEVLDLKANPKRKARGIIVESRLDRGRGPLATVLIQTGTLKVGDNFVGGAYAGRVKAMFDEKGNKLEEVPPGYPVQLLGFDGTPQAGESVIVMETEKAVKNISGKRQALQREQAFKQIRTLSLETLSKRIQKGEVSELPLIIKGDVNGSVEALSDSLMKLNSEEVGVNIIHRGVGAITEHDVNLAAASSALIIGFMVHPNLKAKEKAAHEHVEIRIYRIIYDAINDVKAALEGMLAPEISENNIGTLEVRQTFKVPKIGLIAGCHVQAGKIERNSKVRLIRDGQEIYEGRIDSLKRFKDDVKEVVEGYECGVGIENFNDVKVGDVIEVYEIVKTKRTLA